jgi:hypothetical protein
MSDRSGISQRRCRRPSMGRSSAWTTGRCRSPACSRQNDQALVIGATLYETGLFGVADRLLEVRIRKADVTADARSSPPGMRAVDAEAMELSDEGGGALETGHQPMLPQWHMACQHPVQPRCPAASGGCR